LNFAIDGWLAQLRHRSAIAEEQRLALQGPKLTARLIHVVPWLGLGVAQLFDLNPLGFLFGNPLGWFLLIASLVMAVGAAKWTARIVRSFDAVEPTDPGVAYAALALVLRSGLGVGSGLKLMTDRGVPIPEGLHRLLGAQTRIGAGLVELLQTQANWERHQLRANQRVHLAKLPIQLLYPMAVLLLPQFMLLTVVPIAVGALTTAG
jgi:tight adherence protein B